MLTSADRERGSATLESVAATAVAALLVVGIFLALPGAQFGGILTNAVCLVKTQAPCAPQVTTQTGSPPTTTSGDTGDRRDQERGTRDDRRGRGEDKSPDESGTEGSGAPDDPLGTPVSGTTVPEPPPPAWKPADEGAGEYDSERAWPWDHAKKLAIEAAANALAGKWPDASRNLLHYLANTGEPLEQDVDQILHDVPGFRTQVDELRTSLAEDAVERARESGQTGPVTFPVNTPWDGYYIDSTENENWFYALGGVSYNLTGQVTVYPPSSPGGPWRYELSTAVNLRDQYNWDQGKSTQIGPITVTDQELARLHRQGLAREYRNQGRSDTSTTKGTVP